MAKVLVLAEHNNQTLHPGTLSVITAASQLGETIEVLVAGSNCDEVVKACAKIGGIEKVLSADSTAYAYLLAENMALLLKAIMHHYDGLLVPATAMGKNILPRVAALLDEPMLTDVIEILDPKTYVRPIYAGNAFEQVVHEGHLKLLSIRPSAFEKANVSEHAASIEKIALEYEANLSSFVSLETHASERPELTQAKVVVSGGRGVQDAQGYQLVEKLADQLGGAVGATRAIVDAGFVPNDYQVGQTGKVVAPQLYVAIGISGAIQHVAGMKGSQVIVAINKDPEAPIFQIADYGLVGDLFELVPAWIKALENNT